ncbi:hypothetical protein OG563_07180 [Nocardia vinacea]|uniref:Transcriptional regulator n=1 Tax=Nocardia vinacea TaxID=96468 RepID=A0ABZ1Z7F2_9NOCA|nr:hypothetical protein [Nocardia vinacea]
MRASTGTSTSPDSPLRRRGERQWDEIWPVAAAHNHAFITLQAGGYTSGLNAIDRAYAMTEAMAPTPDMLAVRGALHLRGSILAARAGRTDTADEHITGAREIAARIGSLGYRNYGSGFRPSNVDIHSVAVPVELSDGATALARAAEIYLPPTTAPSRVGHHFIDLSRAFVMHGDPQRALACLEKARRVAPEVTRYHPMVHDTIRAIARARRGMDKLGTFAKWANVKI